MYLPLSPTGFLALIAFTRAQKLPASCSSENVFEPILVRMAEPSLILQPFRSKHLLELDPALLHQF